MNKQRIINAATLSAMGILASTSSTAGAPVWSVTPIGNTTISVPANVQASISYRITNNSSKPHKLVMQPIAGLTQVFKGRVGSCSSPFTLPNKGSSCVLTLQTPSTGLTAGIYGGPSICTADVTGNPDTSQCYQPETQGASLNLQLAPAPVLGEALGGGKVACLLGAPYNNLIAATADNINISPGIIWGDFGVPVGPTAQSSVDGASNTAAIVSDPSEITLPNAATTCSSYAVGANGQACVAGSTCYNDWFLPAKDQLDCLNTNAGVVGGFGSVPYWSSSESATGGAWAQLVPGGSPYPLNGKLVTLAVRCVRALSL